MMNGVFGMKALKDKFRGLLTSQIQQTSYVGG